MTIRSATLLFATMCALALSPSGCTWKTELAGAAAAIHVERDRELVITDDAVLGALSRNGDGGALSFRSVMEHLPLRDAPGQATLAWMTAWSARLRDEGDASRAGALDGTITCAWLRRNPANLCPATCDGCASTALRLEDAPFRLVAVANRTDLSVMPDRAAEGGEARLVFALTDGAADSPDSPALPLTVIVEYAQDGTAKDRAAQWHALGAVVADAFPGELGALAGALVQGGTLAQIRTGDAATGPLVLHEFHLDAGVLAPRNVRNTPSWSAVPEADVRAFAASNADAIASGTHVLPSSWLAKSSSLDAVAPAYLATVASHDALVHGTCGGCHHDADHGFQIDPLAHGAARLSRFLVDPSKDQDEIGRRTEWMQLTLSQ